MQLPRGTPIWLAAIRRDRALQGVARHPRLRTDCRRCLTPPYLPRSRMPAGASPLHSVNCRHLAQLPHLRTSCELHPLSPACCCILPTRAIDGPGETTLLCSRRQSGAVLPRLVLSFMCGQRPPSLVTASPAGWHTQTATLNINP